MWRRKTGIIILFIISIIFSSCATTRKRDGRMTGTYVESSGYNILTEAKSLNINPEGFVIKKAEVELRGTQVEGSFNLYAKVNPEGDFFASIRGPLGIELVRAISTGDSVFVINKMSRVILYGSREEILRRSGLPKNLIEIFMGDIPGDVTVSNAIISGSNDFLISYPEGNYIRDIIVNREERKISEENIKTSGNEPEYLMRFGNFIKRGKKKYPSTIEIKSVGKMFHVKISITELNVGFNERIKVVLPGYRRESL
ncbi:MAG TPA: DUF4292 domain-containing protein [Bacteroidales bacterium]|nr:DUF4292 domain-containing protein [Bacteroidales bacterium]